MKLKLNPSSSVNRGGGNTPASLTLTFSNSYVKGEAMGAMEMGISIEFMELKL